MSQQMVGSLQNRLSEHMIPPEPEVGMGCTELLYSDRHAYEIIEVKDARHCKARALDCKMKPGTDWLDQDYEYSSNPKNPVVNLFKTCRGYWVERYSNGSYGSRFRLGVAEEYRDPSF